MDPGPCRLCRQARELRESHVIPNALFRKIKQRDGGKLIVFDDSAHGLVDQTIESWSEPLFCQECEQRFSVVEQYALEALDKASRATPRRREGARLTALDYGTFKRFTTSLLWRASVSTLVPFAKVSLPAGSASVWFVAGGTGDKWCTKLLGHQKRKTRRSGFIEGGKWL